MKEIKRVLDKEIVRTAGLLSSEQSWKSLISSVVEQSFDLTHTDIAALYLFENQETRNSPLRLVYKRGKFEVPLRLKGDSDLISFLRESGESVVLTEPVPGLFTDLLLTPGMKSGMALPLQAPKTHLGILIINSKHPRHFNRERFDFLESFAKMAGGLLHNSRMFQETKDYLKTIEEMERYQENIFSSMSNLLITTDEKGTIRYFNSAAARRLGWDEGMLGEPLQALFKQKISNKVLKTLKLAEESGELFLGIEGIFKTPGGDMDYSLNISPLRGKRGKHMGLTLLMSDQTAEKELKNKVSLAVEERRVIKDMFARYLSSDIVQQLTEAPETVKPGGDKKNATVFFADIRGYTSFSEGKDPTYIIDVLNAYFSEAVEIVIKYGGYIDKFIGDCIMAAWGVPMVNEESDAVHAVSCALEIQQLVASSARRFFTGKADHLKIGIGMHTGPLVAGNLGSDRRMDYSVIGDTVNVAARLEGVAEADEVIITEDTRNYIQDSFKLEDRGSVKVKGKDKALRIYNVIDKV